MTYTATLYSATAPDDTTLANIVAGFTSHNLTASGQTINLGETGTPTGLKVVIQGSTALPMDNWENEMSRVKACAISALVQLQPYGASHAEVNGEILVAKIGSAFLYA